MVLSEWAKKWNVSVEALTELRRSLGVVYNEPEKEKDNYTEAQLLSLLRLEASEKGMRLWRNNVGAAVTKDGSFIRFGIANESMRLNKVLKSSDLIGLKPVLITEKHIGCVIGQFVAREVKKHDWVFKGDEREQAQLRFINLIVSLGGDACFATKMGTL